MDNEIIKRNDKTIYIQTNDIINNHEYKYIISIDDLDFISQFNWTSLKGKAIRTTDHFPLANLILGVDKEAKIKFKNKKKSDYRKNNLKILKPKIQEKKICCIDGCDKKVTAKNMCRHHYNTLYYKPILKEREEKQKILKRKEINKKYENIIINQSILDKYIFMYDLSKLLECNLATGYGWIKKFNIPFIKKINKFKPTTYVTINNIMNYLKEHQKYKYLNNLMKNIEKF